MNVDQNDELEFNDITLDEPISVDSVIDEQKDPQEPAQEPVEPEPKKQRGRPKKDAESKGTSTNSKPEETVEPVSGEEANEEPEEEIDNDSEVEEGFIKSIAAKLGIELQEGEDFEDSEDGLIEFTQRAADEIADAKLNGWLEALPPVATDFFDYLQMLGEEATEENIKSFFTAVNPEIDYKSVDLTNEDVQKSVMRTFFKKMDYTDEEIKEAIDDLEISGTIGKQAKIAAGKLGAMQEKQREVLLAQQKEQERAKREATQRFFGNIKQVIENGKVNNFTIPVTEKKGIYDYDTQGAFMKDLNEILKDPTKRVELAIAVKNKFNLNKYVAKAAETQKVNSLRDKLKGGTNKLKNGSTSGAVTNSEIDWDDL
jgi:hypothetical protein